MWKKGLLLTMMLVAVITLPGCTSVTPEQMQALGDNVQALTDQVEQLQVADAQAAKPALTAEANQEIDRLQAQLVQIGEALKNAQYTGGGDLTTLIEGAMAMNNATSPFNPYSVYINLALLAALTVVGAFAKKKTTEASQVNKALTETVKAIEVYKNTAADTSFLKRALAEAQSKETKVLVTEIRS